MWQPNRNEFGNNELAYAVAINQWGEEEYKNRQKSEEKSTFLARVALLPLLFEVAAHIMVVRRPETPIKK